MKIETMTLSEVADALGMRRSNVRKFLSRKGVVPIEETPTGSRWRRDVVEAIRAAREADVEARERDRRRRETHLQRRTPMKTRTCKRLPTLEWLRAPERLPDERVAEYGAIVAYWPRSVLEAIRFGSTKAPPWRLLYNPTEWRDVDRDRIVSYCVDYVAEHGRWPKIDDLHHLAGRRPNRPTPADAEDQLQLGAVA